MTDRADPAALADRLAEEADLIDLEGITGDIGTANLLRAATTALRSAVQWKAEAAEVIEGWERVWSALGRPGALGQSKSQAVLDLFTADTATVIEVAVPEHCPRCGSEAWQECHGSAVDTRRVVVAPEDVLRDRIMDVIGRPDLDWLTIDDVIVAVLTEEDR